MRLKKLCTGVILLSIVALGIKVLRCSHVGKIPYDIAPQLIDSSTVEIFSQGHLTEKQMASYLVACQKNFIQASTSNPNSDPQKLKKLDSREKISSKKAHALAKIYLRESRIEGINWDVAFIQMCHETGFLTFLGDVEPAQFNFAGIGTFDGKKGHAFSSIKEGVRAHIQHLKAYSSTKPLQNECVDPRYELVKNSPNFGNAKTLADLTGKWATDPLYDQKIAKKLTQAFSF